MQYIPLIKSLPLHTAILIRSTFTDGVFLDEERRCYLFFYKKDAERFVKEHESLGTEQGKEQYYNKEELMAQCYREGARIIVLSDGARNESVHLSDKRVRNNYYNNQLNAAITLFKETKKIEYLDDMAKCNFIVPIRIKELGENQGQELLYGTVRSKDSFQFLAFTDIEEYQKWSTEVTGWDPLLVDIDVMGQIAKEHGYLVNPLGNRLILPSQVLSKYRKKEEEEKR